MTHLNFAAKTNAMAFEIVPRVWFGPAGITWRPEEICKFTHIVNCDSARWSTNIWARDNRTFLHLWSDDDESFRILDTHFETLRTFIDDALTDPNALVFIHCRMGINRSGALATAYACYKTCLSAHAVISDVRTKWNEPYLTNSGFIDQLPEKFP